MARPVPRCTNDRGILNAKAQRRRGAEALRLFLFVSFFVCFEYFAVKISSLFLPFFMVFWGIPPRGIPLCFCGSGTV